MKTFNKMTEKQMQSVNGGFASLLIAGMALGTAGVIGGAAGALASK